jgi:hypothetical protein
MDSEWRIILLKLLFYLFNCVRKYVHITAHSLAIVFCKETHKNVIVTTVNQTGILRTPCISGHVKDYWFLCSQHCAVGFASQHWCDTTHIIHPVTV